MSGKQVSRKEKPERSQKQDDRMKQAPLQDIRILQGILFIFTLFSIKRNCNLYAKARTKTLVFGEPAVENSDFLLKKVYLYVII